MADTDTSSDVTAYPVRPRIASAGDVRLIGGDPAVDFVNTVLWRGTPRVQDVIGSYGDLVVWLGRSGLVGEETAASLADLARAHPGRAQGSLERAVELRRALHGVLSARAAGGQPAPADLAAVGALYADSLGSAKLAEPAGRRPAVWTWADPPSSTDRAVWPLAHAAQGLLAADPAPPIRRCDADECGWLFIDHSRNRSRRWCSMEGCGSRAKMRRHYARSRSR
jgi:predicted RNA-binding Zn ribbon-like protein